MTRRGSSCLSYLTFQQIRAEILRSSFPLRPTCGEFVEREQICSANYFANLLSRAEKDERAPKYALRSHGTHFADVSMRHRKFALAFSKVSAVTIHGDCKTY
jgi:hypothetical protein